jgi:hypothetical protein
MGMRITKYLCYFAENVEFDSAKLSDWLEDANPKDLLNSPELKEFWEKHNDTISYDGYDISQFSNLSIKAGNYEHEQSKYGAPFSSNFVYDEEFFVKKAVGVIPFICEDGWRQHASDIDYEEFYLKFPNHEQNHDIRYLDKSLWPYEGYMDKNTGKYIKHRNDVVQMAKHFKVPDELNEYVNKLTGYNTFEEMQENAVPYVPIDVYMMLHFSGAFQDPWKTYLSLRPAIVEWFS